MDDLRAFERAYADALLADDPVTAFLGADGVPANLRAAVASASPDGLRMTALLVVKLRFERLMNGSPRAIEWFDRDPASFAAAFRRYHNDVAPTARDPRAEHRLFDAWVIADEVRVGEAATGVTRTATKGPRDRVAQAPSSDSP